MSLIVGVNREVFFYGFNSVIGNTASQSPRLAWTQAFPSQNISDYNMWHRHYKDKHQPTLYADVCGNTRQFPTEVKI